MKSTGFIPEIDGYNFSNTFVVDQNERQKVRELINQSLPAAIGVLAPIIGAISPLVIATLGPVFAIAGPFLPFLPLFAPLIAKQLCETISDEVADGIYGFCGGMAYSSVDYYNKNWLLPRGSMSLPLSINNGGTAGSETLRNYIWCRLLDSSFNDVDKWIVWTAMNQFFGDYGKSWLKDQCVSEIAAIESKINNGEPWPIGLIAGSTNLSDSHVVVAISFEKTGTNKYCLGLYDNNEPNGTCMLNIDLSGSTAIIQESNGDTWGALFLTKYSPMAPPPALVLSSGLTLVPNSFTGVGKTVNGNFDTQFLGYGPTPNLHLGIGGKNWCDGEEPDSKDRALNEGQQTSASPNISFKFHQATVFDLAPKVRISNNNAISYKHIPWPDGSDFYPVKYKVTPKIQLNIRTSGSCQTPFAENAQVTCIPDIRDVQGIGIQNYSWQLVGASIVQNTGQHIVIDNPPANNLVQIKLSISLNDGTEAYGEIQYVTMDHAFAERLNKLCKMAHTYMLPKSFRIPRIKPFTDPVPFDWFNRKEVRTAVNPAEFMEHMESMVGKMKSVMATEKYPAGNTKSVFDVEINKIGEIQTDIFAEKADIKQKK